MYVYIYIYIYIYVYIYVCIYICIACAMVSVNLIDTNERMQLFVYISSVCASTKTHVCQSILYMEC